MKIFLLVTLTVTIAASFPVPTLNSPPPKKTMKAFRSEQELKRYFRTLAKKQRRKARGGGMNSGGGVPVAVADAMSMTEVVTVTSAAETIKSESVTNVQHAGVDEGGIVKVHGDHLVVLRRGRLFTVAIGDGALNPISSVDAFAPEINPSST